jgi:hypothetical protein
MIVRQWSEVSDRFRDALIVGNGGSMAVSSGFSYRSLLEEARTRGYLNPQIESLFDQFQTEDFELLLRHLFHAQMVNDALGVGSQPVSDAYSLVKHSLIQAVPSVHCAHSTTEPHLANIAAFMARFKTVFSLNYDLIVYWALLRSNESQQAHRFKDCFYDGRFRSDWANFRNPYRQERSVTLMFYPHGALHLAADKDGDDIKLTGDGASTFLETIFEEWESNEVAPLIVCDGNSEQKRRRIGSSTYLSTVLTEVLPSSGPSLVCYGWALGEQEDHILRQLGGGRYKRIAISVYQPNTEAGKDYVTRVLRKVKWLELEEIVFFDAASAGCWVNEQALAA